MRNKFYLSILMIFLISISTAELASAGKAGTLDERVREKILDNGLRIVVVERHTAPVFFTLISFRVGASHESPDHSGLSHFLEHMLFKGSKNVGTKDYASEVPIMDELEEIAGTIRDIQITLKPWRFKLFDEYAAKVKSELTAEIRQEIGSDEAAGWRAVLEQLPSDFTDLPEEWSRSQWLLKDRENNYWTLYRDLLEHRALLADLIVQQREFINQNELSQIYEMRGGRRQNAFTSYDQTTYMVGLPSNCLELFLYLEADRFTNPVFREFYSEKKVVMEEKRMYMDEPGGLLWETFMSTAFRAHPYGRPIIGWLSDIELTLRTDMEEHFKRFYAPNNCQLTIVGDVNAKEVFKLAEKYFGDWKPSKVADEMTVVEPEQNGERRIQVEFDAEPRLGIGFHVPVAPHPDSYALTMIDYILSAGRTSRMYKSIFVEQSLTASSPSTGQEPADRYPNLFYVEATPKAPHTTEEVETAILEEIEKLKDEPVTDRELERIRNRFKMHQLSRMGSNYALAFTINSAFVNRGDWRSVTEDFNRLEKVTADDIQRVAKKYFTAKNRTVAILVKPLEMAETETTGMEE
ncbi:insulinase family protein [bacterium]|nr:insulinase family protein [bacterium]